MRLLSTVLSIFLSTAAFAEALTVTTFVGSDGGAGDRDGIGSAARFNWPTGVVVDAVGNIIVADTYNHTIRHITPAGAVTTLAGLSGAIDNVDGQGGSARFTTAWAIAIDSAGTIYAADNDLRKISPSGAVSTLLSLIPTTFGIAVDSSGNIFLTDLFHARIKKITPTGTMTDFATTAAYPRAMTIDASNNLYFATDGGTLYKCTPAGVVTPVTSLADMNAIAADASGNLYVAASSRIYKVAPNGTVSDFAGSSQGQNDGIGSGASFVFPRGLALSPDGSILYVTDQLNHNIRRITVPGASVTTLAGKANQRGTTDATGLNARFSNPSDIVLAPDGNLYLADEFNYRIRRITAAGDVSTFAGGTSGNLDGTGTAARFNDPLGIAVGPDGDGWALYVTDGVNNNVRKITSGGVVTTVASGQNSPFGIAVAADGDVYFSEAAAHTIKKIDMPWGAISIFAGQSGAAAYVNATGTAARFNTPLGLTIDGSGNLFVADSYNYRIRQIVLSTAEVTTLAGSGSSIPTDGTGLAAAFFYPSEIHAIGSDLYVSDMGAVRLIGPGAVVTTIAGVISNANSINRDGTGSLVRFADLTGIAGDSNTNLYFCDQYGSNVRKGRVAGISDIATVSDDTPLTNTVVQLDTDPDTATSWTWSIERRPTGSTAELSATNIRNPTFTPDIGDVYTFLVRAEGPNGIRYSTVNITASNCPDPLTAVVASTGTTEVCGGAGNGTATANATGGMTLAYQWGYRTYSGGGTTPIPGATSSSYSINGYDFGGSGDRFLVVTVTPSCGVPRVSNQLYLHVTAPVATISASSGVFANSTQNFASVPDAGAGATYTWGITNGTITAGRPSARRPTAPVSTPASPIPPMWCSHRTAISTSPTRTTRSSARSPRPA